MTVLPTDPTPRRGQVAQPPAAADRAPERFWMWVAACLYLAFVVYGSLVPLRFQSLPWDQAVERFWAMPYLALGIGSRADWVANILLFIPLCFLWAGVFWPRRQAGWRIAVAGLTLAAAFALSLAIEFVQLYFPQRTVSLNDVVAETAGAVIGISLWWALGQRASRWLQSLAMMRGTVNVAQRLLTVYLLALIAYNLLPLDLTLSPVEVYHKWREGKLILLPFTTPYADNAQRAYDLFTDIAIWVPAAALWRLTGQRSKLQAWTATVTVATLIEVLQLFVYSRVSDSTDIFTAAIGAAVGVALARPRSTTPAGSRPRQGRGALRWAFAALVWLAVLVAVFWFPFDFNFDRSFLRERVMGANRVPFEAYYFGTEFRAVTEVLHKLLFFAPLGFVLYRFKRSLPPTWPSPVLHCALLLLVLGAAAGIESGQLALPTKNADLTDLALEFLGGAIGYFGSLLVAARLGSGERRPGRQP